MAQWIISNSGVGHGFAAERIEPGKTEEAMELLLEIARWLNSQGSAQWGGLLTGDDNHGLESAAERGEAILFRDIEGGPGREWGRAAGMVILMQKPGSWDRELWGEDGHEPYVYLHRLAVSRSYSGTGLGRAMLQWAQEGAAFPGKAAIRLDCIASNPKLGEFYRSSGYEFKGTTPNGFCLFEKALLLG
ncbi:GNAT family N-acetyltransferase [Paenibacillus herberti]|uniref:GNAT family N-acetyltransferase n=1 Tax=Paenibacillus herberti TaxID=1619309 RepID=A0A229NW56_9BACL|nr:GNAT family N-acetyltransferase [Paenibacillus herberti]OXM14090.1 GNAT family N-acetyltransferase [Paenibacillus herberti]